MDDVDRVLVFRDVVESGGFSQAAARRGVVHSTISRQVKELEESLGVLLMTRTTRTRSLTAAGELVFRYAREIGNRYAEMVHELERLEQLEGGELRVHALVHVGASLVMPAVERFVAEHPQVELQLSFDDSPLDFYKGGLDLAVTVGLPRAPQLVVHKLCPNDVCIVAAPRLAARHKTPTTPTDLLSWPLVAYKSGDVEVTTWPYEQDGAIHALEIKPNVTVNNGESLRVAVLRGLGVGYLSRFSAMAELRCGDLVELLPEVTLPPYESVYTVKSDVALVSPRVEAFEACLRSVALELT